LLKKLVRALSDVAFGNGEPTKKRFPVHSRSSCFLRRGGSRCGCAQFLNAYSVFQELGRS
jgi:hypothetical protein